VSLLKRLAGCGLTPDRHCSDGLRLYPLDWPTLRTFFGISPETSTETDRSSSNRPPSIRASIVSSRAAQNECGGEALTLKKAQQEPRCPYCVLGTGFRLMKVLSNGRQICEKCGHIVFPNDMAFRCPCPKCIVVNLSSRIRRLRGRY